MKRFTFILAAVSFFTCVQQAKALTLIALDKGWYAETGLHLPLNLNYFVGRTGSFAFEFRNFSVFDLSGITLPIASATLRLFNQPSNSTEGYLSPDPTETLALFDVSTPIAALVGGTGGISAFTDLGTGTGFGSTTVSSADNGKFVSIMLNASALSALNSAGGLFGIGGALTTLGSLRSPHEGVFADTHVFGKVELDITFVPEPSTFLLISTSLLGLAGYGLRKKKRVA